MAVTTFHLIQAFVHSIDEDIKRYQQLLDLLQQQKMLYFKFDEHTLSSIVSQQMVIIEQLSRSASERSQCIRKLGLPSNEQSVYRIFNALPSRFKTQVREQWSLLKLLVKECQQMNRSNGQSSAALYELINQIQHPVRYTYEECLFY
ncbi:flagellar export chaperone FlgN [Vibrio mimicus]